MRTYDRRLADRIWQRRLAGALVGSFAALATLLAAVGLYGVLSYMVGQQTREIGVRIALGATTRSIVLHILGRALRLVTAGLIIGGLLVMSSARLLTGLLYGVAPLDVTTLLVGAVVLAGVAMLACYVPVRRATRVDPLVALRAE